MPASKEYGQHASNPQNAVYKSAQILKADQDILTSKKFESPQQCALNATGTYREGQQQATDTLFLNN